MKKFEEGEFVVRLRDGPGDDEVLLIVEVEKRSKVQPNLDRFKLQARDGTTYSNIGAYSFRLATHAETEAALAAGLAGQDQPEERPERAFEVTLDGVEHTIEGADHYVIAPCADPNCPGVHIIACRTDGSPLCEIMLTIEQLAELAVSKGTEPTGTLQ